MCVSVCLSVCSLLRYRLNVFLPPLPEVGRPIFLDIRGKVMERSDLRFDFFFWKGFIIAKQKKNSFLSDFDLQNMVETTLPAFRIGQEMLCLPYAGFFFQIYRVKIKKSTRWTAACSNHVFYLFNDHPMTSPWPIKESLSPIPPIYRSTDLLPKLL